MRHGPISSLPADVLWRIFDDYATMLNDETPNNTWCTGLFFLRHCSQVSRLWREVALSSPATWARVINVGYLSQACEEWRDEVMRRTGTAGLVIMAEGVPYRTEDEDQLRAVLYLIQLLETYWARIVGLSISSAIAENIPGVWGKVVELLHRPSPSLRHLSFRISTYLTSSAHVEGSDLRGVFSDSAPQMRRFSTWGTRADLRALWFKHVRELHLGDRQRPREKHDLVTLISALTRMPHLENLALYECFTAQLSLDSAATLLQSTSENRTTMRLPNLRQLVLRHALPQSLAFLRVFGDINPRCGVHLDIVTRPWQKTETEDLWYEVAGTFFRYMHAYLDIHTVTNLSVLATLSGLAVWHCTTSADDFVVRCGGTEYLTQGQDDYYNPYGDTAPGFSFGVTQASKALPFLSPYLIRECASAGSKLARVQFLSLDIDDAIALGRAEVACILRAANQVRILRTHLVALNYFQQLLPDMIPLLEELRVTYLADDEHETREYFVDFFSWREMDERKVGLLRLGGLACQAVPAPGMLSYLRNFKGLETVWDWNR